MDAPIRSWTSPSLVVDVVVVVVVVVFVIVNVVDIESVIQN